MDTNKSNNSIFNYVFNKNTFSLSKPSNIIKNKDLSYCQKYSLKNNKPGFKFYGNNNKCFLYSNQKPTKKLDDSVVNNYSIRKFVKDKKQKYATLEQQSNPYYYFNELNHYNFEGTNLLKKNNVQNLNDCMDSCLNNKECNSVLYLQQPNSCNFYDKINLIKDKNKNYDLYTINQKNKVDSIIQDCEEEEENDLNLSKQHDVHEINNDKYTNCFTNEIYNNFNTMKNSYNHICKNDLGDEYVFSNNNNHKNVVKCENDKIKVLCSPQFIEHFNYNKSNFLLDSNDKTKKYTSIIIIVFIILTAWLLYFYLRNKRYI